MYFPVSRQLANAEGCMMHPALLPTSPPPDDYSDRCIISTTYCSSFLAKLKCLFNLETPNYFRTLTLTLEASKKK